MRKLVGLFAGAAILVAACGGTSTTTPAPSTAPAESQPADSASPSQSAAAEGPVDLFGTSYAPEEGTSGGTVIIGDWQEATQFNPYYLGQVTEANVASLVWHSLLTITQRLPLRAAARRRADPDHRQRWREGPGRQRRRDDGHLEAPRRPQVVRR